MENNILTKRNYLGILKVLTFSFFSLVLVVSCSTDNENESSTNNPIVGNWILVSRTVSDVPVALDECETLIVLTVRENQTLFSQFNTSEVPEKCQTLAFFELAWEQDSASFYNITLGTTMVSTMELNNNQLIERLSDRDWVNFYERAE
ncbi:MAG: lipocalin family protein [Bacteroidota bacterium]